MSFQWSGTTVAGTLCFGNAGAATGNTFDGNGRVTFTAAGTETVYCFGAQNELGAFPTSYIPTTTAAVARSADLPVGSVAGAGINTTQGTIAVRFQPSVAAQNSSAVILEGSGGVGVTIGYNGSVNVQGWDRIAGRTFVGQTGGVTVNELIMSYGSVASAESFNGLTAAYTGSIGISPWGTTFNIGSRSGSSLFYNGYIRGVAFYNQMLTQAQQNRLTAALAF